MQLHIWPFITVTFNWSAPFSRCFSILCLIFDIAVWNRKYFIIFRSKIFHEFRLVYVKSQSLMRLSAGIKIGLVEENEEVIFCIIAKRKFWVLHCVVAAETREIIVIENNCFMRLIIGKVRVSHHAITTSTPLSSLVSRSLQSSQLNKWFQSMQTTSAVCSKIHFPRSNLVSLVHAFTLDYFSSLVSHSLCFSLEYLRLTQRCLNPRLIFAVDNFSMVICLLVSGRWSISENTKQKCNLPYKDMKNICCWFWLVHCF